ncbi:unnamed protein product [Rhizoctonia solani]|uniref:NAD(+) diphosphatase n=1 Tax=Rhizoctonia solani TaxID=456999 RepID=A0A8H3GGR3_9AGAM|nr:unnamed protein product [Rhizoctonia solani]
MVAKCGTVCDHMHLGSARCEFICPRTYDGRLAWPTQILSSMWITNISPLGRLEAELHFGLALGRESRETTLPLLLRAAELPPSSFGCCRNHGKKTFCPSAHSMLSLFMKAVLDETGDRILLGRNKKFPSAFYSTLAGFLEPGESFEDAVKREIWEESGIVVTRVRYHSGQPWVRQKPYPANLMIGCYASADSSQTIRTDLDNELEDAKWFTREEVLSVLAHPDGTNIRRREYKNFDEAQDQPTKAAAAAGPIDPQPPKDQPPFRVPPQSAIAGVLISQWAKGEVPGLSSSNNGALPLKGKI